MHDLVATRQRALALMAAFQPHMGRRYASGRNYDRGPGRHTAVSGLSPYIRRRLITEAEVAFAALEAHGPEAAEKFIQEVIWRGYFKGWLERRPSIWAAYQSGLANDLNALEVDAARRQRVDDAERGATGIECFDAWAQELVATGYLHNHARMWFASIWIFTLELPWRLGADFFYRHLLDGDPASNTLGWRWVAGLHTRGKAYQARAWNIAKFTNQRFAPRDADLAASITPLDDQEPEGPPPAQSPRDIAPPTLGAPTALLITEEDCSVEDFDMTGLDIRGVATLSASPLRSDRPVAPMVARFEAEALSDAAQRLSTEAQGLDTRALTARDPSALAAWAAGCGASQIATPYAPVGPLSDWLRAADPVLRSEGLTLREWRRDWDVAIWRHASAGFFKVKAQIPRILAEMEAA